jgi:hypothetical protein
MAHLNQFKFCERVSTMFPKFFTDVRVLDIGSMDINGNNRSHFKNSTFIGIDIGEGPNVDIVCSGHLYSANKNFEKFNTIISTECFEHDCYYKETILNIVENLLLPGGLFIFSCATNGRQEHGTTRTSPNDSPFTNDYYKNLTEEDIREFLDLNKYFSDYSFSINDETHDLYFWGIKNKIDVDVIILTNSKDEKYFRMTKESIVSLKNSSNVANFNIILVEDNIKSKYTDLYKRLGCNVVFNNKKFSFSNSINYGLNHCKSRFVCLSNNDVVFDKNWFFEIYKNIDLDDNISVYSTLDKYLNLELPSSKLVEGYKPVGIHSGWCHVIDTHLLKNHKYLSEEFDIWFMDDDFCMRLQRLGLKQVLVKNSIVYHLGKSSINLYDDSNSRTSSDREKFLKKYNGELRIESCMFYENETRINFESFGDCSFKFRITGDFYYEETIDMKFGISYFISIDAVNEINLIVEDSNRNLVLDKKFINYEKVQL